MITATNKCDQRKRELTSVYFPHSGHADMHFEKMYKNIEIHRNNEKHVRISAGDFNAQLSWNRL